MYFFLMFEKYCLKKIRGCPWDVPRLLYCQRYSPIYTTADHQMPYGRKRALILLSWRWNKTYVVSMQIHLYHSSSQSSFSGGLRHKIMRSRPLMLSGGTLWGPRHPAGKNNVALSPLWGSKTGIQTNVTFEIEGSIKSRRQLYWTRVKDASKGAFLRWCRPHIVKEPLTLFHYPFDDITPAAAVADIR
jgi:hypothetical protein